MSVCLYFVVPCYNDADTLEVSVPIFLNKLQSLMGAGTISQSSRLMLLNDMSRDNTWDIILRFKEQNDHIVAVDLAENAGEQNTLLAGMVTAVQKADCVITMDSDLQDDINAVDAMLKHYSEGCDIVYGVRSSRPEDGVLDRVGASCFYALMRFAKTGLISQHSNYRLMSRQAVNLLNENQARYYFLPCVACEMPLKSATVSHVRHRRAAGHSGYNLVNKTKLALKALLVHSAFLLRLCAVMALLFAVPAVAGTVWSAVYWTQEGMPAVDVCIISCALLASSGLFLMLRIRLAHIKKAMLQPCQSPRYQIKTILE